MGKLLPSIVNVTVSFNTNFVLSACMLVTTISLVFKVDIPGVVTSELANTENDKNPIVKKQASSNDTTFFNTISPLIIRMVSILHFRNDIV